MKIDFETDNQTKLFIGFYGIKKNGEIIEVDYEGDGIYKSEDLLNFNDVECEFVYLPCWERKILKENFKFEEIDENEFGHKIIVYFSNYDSLGFEENKGV